MGALILYKVLQVYLYSNMYGLNFILIASQLISCVTILPLVTYLRAPFYTFVMLVSLDGLDLSLQM